MSAPCLRGCVSSESSPGRSAATWGRGTIQRAARAGTTVGMTSNPWYILGWLLVIIVAIYLLTLIF